MAKLDISTFSGHVQTVELDKRQAISVGTHPSNDVQVEGDDVEIMHCRISYNKQGEFEVVAAGGDGVEVNGTLVQKVTLGGGDVIQVGDTDITFLDEVSESPATGKMPEAEESSAFGLVPLSGEINLPLPPLDEDAADDAPLTAEEIDLGSLEENEDERPRKRSKEKRSRSKKKSRKESKERSDREKPRRDKSRQRKSSGPKDGEREDLFDLDDGADGDESAKRKKSKKPTPITPDDDSPEDKVEEKSVPADDKPGLKDSLQHRLHQRAKRPGERDPVRSPLVLGLGGGAALLTLIGLTFYFVIGRQTTQTRYDEAQSLMDEGKYAQAIKTFDQFIAVFPKDPLADKAKIQLGISKIERHTSGASPDWTSGLKELNAFVNGRRDLPDFDDHREGIRKRSEQIAEGAAITAGKVFDRSLLKTSDDAGSLLTRYSPEDLPPTDALKRVQSAYRVSEAAILKHETTLASFVAIDAAVEKKLPMEALRARRDLLRRYPDLEKTAALTSKLTAILDTEQSLVQRADEPIDALTDDHPVDLPPPLTLAFHARSRTDEVSVGRNVYGYAKDTVYAVDSITGVPVWRRVIGWDAPFFPVPVTTSVPALLVFSTQHNELQLLDQKTGSLLWRQPAAADVTGRPTIDEGQAYVVSQSGELSKIDLGSGQVTSRLTFSQSLVAPVVSLLDGHRLVVAGSQEVLYTLKNRPLECTGVTYFGHKPGSVVAPLLPMGALVLMTENLPGEEALLRILDSRPDESQLVQIGSRKIPGHVIDPPVIRGRDVFVPSTGERVSSFSASDESGQQPLTPGPRYEPEGAEESPMFLATGPDRQVWMASRYLRQLKLTTDAIEPGSKVVNIGIATQPIQQQGKKLYIGRSLPYSSATTLFQTDRDDLTSDWQTVVGARLIAWGSYPGQEGLVAVTEAGDVFRVNDRDFDAGPFLTTTTVRLNLPEGLESPLGGSQLPGGDIIVWCGQPAPQLWTINRVGQAGRPSPLPEAVQCPPVTMGVRLVLPLPGKLHLLRTKSGQGKVQDYELPQGADTVPVWRQLIGVDDTTVVAASETGQLTLIKSLTSPQPYLAEAGRLDLGEPLEYGIGSSGGVLAVATGQRLRLIDAGTLEPRADVELPAIVSNDVWMSGNLVFAETARQALHVFNAADGLAKAMTLPLDGVPVAGRPLVSGSLVIVPLTDGRLQMVSMDTGEVTSSLSVGQALDGGPRLWGPNNNILGATVDGSLIGLGTIPIGNQP